MFYAKLAVIAMVSLIGITACFDSTPKHFTIAGSKSYEASLFRQQCAICHGPEGEGKILDDGTKVPSLREGEFKFKSEEEILTQISSGGNGMTPFRDILTDRERKLLAAFVYNDLRKH